MVRARLWAGAALLSAAGAVAFAGWVMNQPRAETVFLAPSPFDSHSFIVSWGLLGLVWAITGAVLVDLRPRNALGWLVLAVGVSQAWAVGLTSYGWGYGLRPSVPWWPAYVGTALYIVGWLIPSTLLLALYPDGRLPGRLWRWPVAAAAVAIVLLTACLPFPVLGPDQAPGWALVPAFPERLGDVLLPTRPTYGTRMFVWVTPHPSTPVAAQWWPEWTRIAGWVFKPLLALSMLTIWVGTMVRLVRARPPRRQQLAWLVCVVMPFLAASLVAPVEFANLLGFVSLSLVPVAVAVGGLRYRLLGIEAVLRRGLVYGTFTAAVVGAYLLVTTVAAAALDRTRLLPGVVAAALVAVGLLPARDRLQRAADRLVYGERRDPLRAVTLLGQRLAITDELDLLPGALASVMAAVRAPGAAVAAPDGRTLASVGAGPEGGGGTLVLPLWFGGTRVGELRVAARRPGESYTNAAETRLLAALALQVAVVVRAFELTEALEAERDRVLAATTTERNRLRADLHDGLGPSLSGVGLGLQALADTLEGTDRTTSTVLLDRIRDEVATAVIEVRRIIDGLRPTTLDTLGLPAAIRRHAETISAALPVQVADCELPPLPLEVENAAYRITTEALSNAVRHADARNVQVVLAAPDGSLQITVADDGHGVGAATAGVGLTSMRRRAEALGGRLELASGPTGTTITATLPLEQQ
jgi:signal transduction histidine kinase